ncbi:NlpC/P60 family protein [Achromobacter phage JWF]|uniref:NlpC/P60 family protein n=1 Tax=Achromobacter phage JWF TaxID=1589748 RepID=UPI000588E444|nr:NlpC/P60 family protein [Achromobacter phage JWF]AJD82917.1 NlpC/P60 family protein [Achromobacter phage JWF]
MSLYSKYVVGFEGRPYVEGRYDCYELVRSWFNKHYDLGMENYARPDGLVVGGQTVLYKNMEALGFHIDQSATLNRLQLGDVLIMQVNTRGPDPNHVGVYVGNGYFLHHMYGRKSEADTITEKWKGRIMDIARHPDVVEVNRLTPLETVSITELMPPNMRMRYEGIPASIVEPDGGTLRPNTP